MEFKFKDNTEPYYTDDPYYELIIGRKLPLDELLEDKEQIKAIESAVDLLQDFMRQAEEKDIMVLV